MRRAVLLLALIACRRGDDDDDTDRLGETDVSDTDTTPIVDDPFDGELGTILFATQVPIAGFVVATSAFGNHEAQIDSLPRGGDLMIRYPDGELRNLTAEAGFGSTGAFQDDGAIAVREPSVHWSGNKALFSMVIGAPDERYEQGEWHWQIYEATGIGRGETVAIRRIDGQDADYDNVSPIYGSDDRILYTSSRPRSGERHLFPQLDEYESAATVTGIWSLDEASGDLMMLEHAPSGAFSLSIDQAGRVLFTKWDHLQRDQQGDSPDVAATYHPLTFDDESAGAAVTDAYIGTEVFPEARVQEDAGYDSRLSTHGFNQFFPWEMNEDGTEEETLVHVGRHELGGAYSEGSFIGDDDLSYYVPDDLHANRVYMTGSAGLFHLREDPLHTGVFYATYAPEFYTASGGSLMRITAPDRSNADEVVLQALTPPYGQGGGSDTDGTFRNPLPMADGSLVAVYTASDDYAENRGSTESPDYNYGYRLYAMTVTGSDATPDAPLTAGIEKSLEWWSPDVRVTWSGALWELDPVEVAPRERPVRRRPVLEEPESSVFAEVGVDVAVFQEWLRDNELALIVSRDVTQRDRSDVFQPYNLRIPGGTESIANDGRVYDIEYLQIFQGDQVRGYGDVDDPNRGRRVLPRAMHGPNLSTSDGPEGSVRLGADGSMAAIVPARRALTWQLTDGTGDGVVRERNWVSFQAGEVRVCAVCHGLNTESQTGDGVPQNQPEALRTLLEAWPGP